MRKIDEDLKKSMQFSQFYNNMHIDRAKDFNELATDFVLKKHDLDRVVIDDYKNRAQMLPERKNNLYAHVKCTVPSHDLNYKTELKSLEMTPPKKQKTKLN